MIVLSATELLVRAGTEAVEAANAGVPPDLESGAIGELVVAMDYWPLIESAVALERAIRESRDPALMPLWVALLAAVRDMPADCARCLPYLVVDTVASLDEPGVLAALSGVLSDAGRTPDLRRAAASALGVHGDPAAVEGLRAALVYADSDDGELRALALEAAMTLAKLGDTSGSSLSVAALHDESPLVRELAVRALDLLRPPGAVRLWAEALCDPDNHVRRSAMWALVDVGTPEAVELVLPLADDLDPDLAENCAVLVGRLIGLSIDPDVDDPPNRAQLAAAWRQMNDTSDEGPRPGGVVEAT
ncbi:HEAT repeat domain-containing protein [Embleya sp. NPDC001921]